MLTSMLACNSDNFTDSVAVGALSDLALQNEQGVNLALTGAYSSLDGVRKNQAGNGWGAVGDDWWFDVIADDRP